MSEDTSDIRGEFMERFAQERGESYVEPTPEATEEPVEGDPEVVEEIIEDGDDSAVDMEGELDPDAEAEEGDPADGETPEVSAEYMELEEKYKSLEKEFSRVTENRKAIEASLEEQVVQATELYESLNDKFSEAEQFTEYFAGMATQPLQQLSQVNPATLTQEQFGQYQQAYQAAQLQAAQHSQLLEQLRTERESVTAQQKEREAKIARERLKVRIPDWSGEKYRALGEVAKDYGYSEKEFFDSTDHRLIILLNEVAASKDAAKVVETKVTKAKTKPPRQGNARPQERNEKGQFKRAQQAFNEGKPGTKGSFAAMKAAQLAAERAGK